MIMISICQFRILLTALIVSAGVARADDTSAVKGKRDLVFAKVNDRELKLDLYLPSGVSNPPLVVWIHGGGWRRGSKNNVPIKKIAEHGFALASISYRFTDVAVFPAQIHDCKGAVRWLRANAKRFGYNADWIAVAGSSAGGHLALLLGTSGGVKDLEGSVGGNLELSSTVQAVIDYFGPSDFVLRGATQPGRAYTDKSGSFALLGGVKGQKLDPEIERFASPAHYVSDDDPPLLIFHGAKDQTVLIDQSHHMVRSYSAAGLSAELVTIPNAGHGGKSFFQGEHFEKAKHFLSSNVPEK